MKMDLKSLDLKKLDYKKIYVYLSLTLFVFLLEFILYFILQDTSISAYWFFIPLFIYSLVHAIKHLTKVPYFDSFHPKISVVVSAVLLFLSIKCTVFQSFMSRHFDLISYTVTIIFILSLILYSNKKEAFSINAQENSEENKGQLFNIFYLNTSKAHEIAMLIDNKIMKTVEREQISEELLKRTGTLSLSKKDHANAGFEYTAEDNSKRRVFESFDVKTTKSIMLKKIYEAIQTRSDPSLGDLIKFENIELTQINYDDTAMLMSILQDSKIRNQGNDSLEVNFSKMIERMLDDFTIDYSFDHKNKHYVLQLPYKAKENFENGYHHNDLQLGKLSIIGIYRGEIDFSAKNNVSSRFFDMVTASMNKQNNPLPEDGGMKLSIIDAESKKTLPFDFNTKRITGKKHLIDVIAIIQEIKLS